MTAISPDPTDTEILDDIALVLGLKASWEPETLETIADLVGLVRPHPGGTPADEYLDAILTDTKVQSRFEQDRRQRVMKRFAQEYGA